MQRGEGGGERVIILVSRCIEPSQLGLSPCCDAVHHLHGGVGTRHLQRGTKGHCDSSRPELARSPFNELQRIV